MIFLFRGVIFRFHLEFRGSMLDSRFSNSQAQNRTILLRFCTFTVPGFSHLLRWTLANAENPGVHDEFLRGGKVWGTHPHITLWHRQGRVRLFFLEFFIWNIHFQELKRLMGSTTLVPIKLYKTSLCAKLLPPDFGIKSVWQQKSDNTFHLSHAKVSTNSSSWAAALANTCPLWCMSPVSLDDLQLIWGGGGAIPIGLILKKSGSTSNT